MKLRQGIFLFLSLLGSLSFAQSDKTFYSLEEALSVPADSVYKLDLSKSKFKEFPTEIFQFKNLEWLSLSKTKLSELPSEFYFPKLEYLDLSKNDFGVFPEEICEIQSLKVLHLQKNHIVEIPSCIGQLSQLEHLDLWFNLIETIPEEFANLRALRFVDFRGMTYTNEFQDGWRKKMPWVKFEFELGCDCGN